MADVCTEPVIFVAQLGAVMDSRVLRPRFEELLQVAEVVVVGLEAPGEVGHLHSRSRNRGV